MEIEESQNDTVAPDITAPRDWELINHPGLVRGTHPNDGLLINVMSSGPLGEWMGDDQQVSGGKWTLPLYSNVPPGLCFITAKVLGSGPPSKEVRFWIRAPAPKITSPGPEVGQRPTISGTAWSTNSTNLAPVTATVVVEEGGQELIRVGVERGDGLGNWSFPADRDWSVGQHTISARLIHGGQVSPRVSHTFTVVRGLDAS